MKLNNKLKLLFLSLVITSLVGCSATHTALRKKNLDVQTKMSASIFLEPVAADKRTIYVQVRNTSDKQALDIDSKVKGTIVSKGYTIVDDPEKANFILQANILKVGKIDAREAQAAMGSGYNEVLAGGAIGAGAGAVSSGHRDAVAIGAAVGALAGFITDAMVKDITFTAITDLQISERAGDGIVVREKIKSDLKQGIGTTRKVTSSKRTKWNKYQTRIVSTANKVNLKFEEAEEPLISGLTRSIAGIL